MRGPLQRGRLGREARARMERVRATVFERDWARCVATPLGSCSGPLSLQHRVGRGMGGSLSVGDGPQWYVTMCTHHNALIEQHAPFAAEARRRGWSLPRTVDAAERVLTTDVLYPDGWWYRLNGDGQRIPVWGHEPAGDA